MNDISSCKLNLIPKCNQKKKKNGVFFLSALGTDMKRYKKKTEKYGPNSGEQRLKSGLVPMGITRKGSIYKKTKIENKTDSFGFPKKKKKREREREKCQTCEAFAL